MNGITPFTLYNCKRVLEQKSPAQLVVLGENQAVIKHVNGLFSFCKIQEIEPVFRFKIMERIDSVQEKNLSSIKDEPKEGIYKVDSFSIISMYLIIFRDVSAVVYIPSNKAVVFWSNAKDMLAHIAKSSLLWIP